MPEHSDILNGLYGLKETGPGMLDLATAVGIGLLLAGIIGIALGLLPKRKTRDRLSQRVAAAQSLAEPEKTAAIVALLRELTDQEAPGEADWIIRAARHFRLDVVLLSRVRAGLYTPSPNPDTEALEQAFASAIARSGG